MGEVKPEFETFARIKVVGIGGSGNAAINRMIDSNLKGIEFIAVNTDAQALHHNRAPRKLHIGKQTTRGLGAGADPEVGRQAAEEAAEEIYETLKGSDMVFITCGMGGGTGTIAASVVAGIAKEVGALTVAIVTRPFSFEGERRKKAAQVGLDELGDKVDTLITIPNDKLLQMIDRKTSLLDAFSVVDEVLKQGVQGISDLITVHGLINLDFADVKAIMANAGSALMGIGRASGDDRATQAARQAIDSPLLDLSIVGAKGVLFNVTGGNDLAMTEVEEAAKVITEAVDPEANIIFGAVLDEKMQGDIKLTVIATGFDPSYDPNEIRPMIDAKSSGFEPIRPTFEEVSTIEPFVTSSSEPRKGFNEPMIETPETVSKKDEKNVDVTSGDEEELDVPAFIRRKME